MTVRNYSEDLVTDLRANFSAANITAHSTRPIIIHDKERISDDSSGDKDAGVLRIGRSTKGHPIVVTTHFEHRPYSCRALFTLQQQTDNTTMEETLTEFQRIVEDILNASSSRTYHHSMLYEIPNNDINPKVEIEFQGVQEYVLL